MSAMEQMLTTEVIFTETPAEAAGYLDAREAVASLNVHSSQPEPEALDTFIELLGVADQEYVEVPEYGPADAEPGPVLDWDEVLRALEESQKILVLVQEMMSATLAEMGIADHDSIRVHADEYGWLRVVGEHPQSVKIEAGLNSAENNQLREYYMSATAGMSMAGSLVGTMAVPREVVDFAREQQFAMAV